MPDPFDDQKRRPPPIRVPSVPRQALVAQPAHPPRTTSRQQEHDHPHGENRNASSSTQQGRRSVTSPLMSPLVQDGSRLPFPQSGSQRSRTSALNALTALLEESRATSRKSEQGSVAPSTTRSRHSERSHQSAGAAQAQLETPDEDARTSRAKIEARSEQRLFKMTGQVPPTPLLNAVGKHEAVIVRQDLREQCRAASAEKKSELKDPIKSPKKKIFGMNLPSFSRSSNNTPAPNMPSKAAQVLGQESRNPTKVVVHPIKPSGDINTPTKAPRSETSKSLPAKLDQSTHTRSHHTSAARRNRAAKRNSPPRGSKPSSGNKDAHPAPELNSSLDSAKPPTPPAKDTPPDRRAVVRSTSPLRRAAPGTDRLRDNYKSNVDDGASIPSLDFGSTTFPFKNTNTESAGKSPTKHLPCSANDYQKLIAGEPLPWASLTQDKSPHEQEISPLRFSPMGSNLAGPVDMPAKRWSEEEETEYYENYEEQKDHHSAPLEGENGDSLQLPDQERRSESYVQTSRNSYSPLLPRFYSPSNRSVQLFAHGETPSKNSDTKRLLCTVTSRLDLSNNGSIEMIFEGNVTDFEPLSSPGHLVNNGNENTMLQTRDDSGLAARVMQELQIKEQRDGSSREEGSAGYLQPDQSSARLTDMLNGVSPRDGMSIGDFRVHHPSAVPSPLKRAPGPIQSLPSMLESVGPFGPPGLPFVPKSVDDHFYMTNEHLDVMGKSSWDHVETLRKELLGSASHKHAQLVSTMEKHAQDLKMQVDSVNEKADRTTEQSHNIHTKLEELFDFIRGDVMGALHMQESKTSDLELNIKELQKTVQTLHKMLEQKQSDAKVNPKTSAPTPAPLPTDRSPPSLVGYYGNMAESGRDGQPSVAHMPGHRNGGLAQEVQTDARTEYGNYGQQWAPRTGYQGRSSKEERHYSATNPYNFVNGAANGGPYGNGYNGGYTFN